MKKTFLILALVGSSLVANAVRQRTRIEVIGTSTPTLPECTQVFEIKEEESPYIPNSWTIVSIRMIEDTCGDVE